MNVKIFYLNFRLKGHSHIGLGVGGMHTEKVLNNHGVKTKLHGIGCVKDIHKILSESQEPISHVIIEAPWIETNIISDLCYEYSDTQWVVRSHSQVAFLQADHKAFQLIREYANLEEHSTNFRLAVNNPYIGGFIQEGYHKHVLLLPNLYWMDRVAKKYWKPPHHIVKCGSFGATRVGKNHTTAASAALVLGQMFGYNIEFYINSGRDEQTGVINIIKDMFVGVPNVKLNLIPWQQWCTFRHWVEHLDVHFTLSSTESFNIVTADCISVGIPVVCGPAITWAPNEWKVNIDSPVEAAVKAHQLMNDPHAPSKGLTHLEKHQNNSIKLWLDYLNNGNRTMPDWRL